MTRRLLAACLFFLAPSLTAAVAPAYVLGHFDASRVSAAGLAGLAVAPSAPWLAAAAGSLGLGCALLMPALPAEAVDRAGPERRGRVVGTVVGGYDACAVAGAVALGVVASRWGYPAVFLAGAAATPASVPVFAAWRARADRPLAMPAATT